MCKPVTSIKGLTAEELLERCKQEDNIPVNLTAMLKHLGISAVPMDFKEVEAQLAAQNPVIFRSREILGALISRGDNAAIFYRKEDAINSHRYRFTIAHELAHACLTGESNHIEIEWRMSGTPIDELEAKANQFAGELLIPESQFYKIIEKLYLPSVHTLARVFDVSDNVMKERIKCLRPNMAISGYNY